MPTFASTIVSIVLAAFLALAAYSDPLWVALVVVVIQLMIAYGPGATNERGRSIPTPRFVPAAVGGIVAVLITLHPAVLQGARGTEASDVASIDSGIFVGLAVGVVVSLFLAIFAQMRRPAPRAHLVLSLSYAVLLSTFAGLAAGWVGASKSLAAENVVAVGAVAVAVALVIWLVPGPRWPVGALSMVGAGVASVVLATQVDLPTGNAVVFGTGLIVGLFAILGEVVARVLTEASTHTGKRWGFEGVLPLALAAPIVFVGSQLLGI
ncbi:hypothetical protein BH09ACT10_BH09ACT10_22510 [soil metagenome]